MTAKLPEPSDAQWEAIRCTDEHVLINAGAGTGKTFTVVAKALYLMGVEVRGQAIESPLALRDIAAITYTTKAAAELKDRLRASLRSVGRRREAYQVDSARVGTIHSFCSDILREFALRRRGVAHPTFLGEVESRILQDDVVREALLDALELESIEGLTELFSVWSVKEVEGWVAELLGHGDHLQHIIAQSDASGGLSTQERALTDLALKAHALLLARLEDNGQMDYDRMIVWTRDLLRDDATVRKALQRRIKVLIIDECQDINPIQREIAYLLADPTRNRSDTTRLVLVGDPKQSIFRFRKADVSVWRSIEADLITSGTGRIIALAESRRSVTPLLAFVDDFVGSLLDTPLDTARGHQNFEVGYAPLTSLRDDTSDDRSASAAVEFITVPAADTGKACDSETVRRLEARAIANRAYELHNGGVAWRDIAVLLCGWGAVDVYMKALRAAGIPAYTLRAEGFYGCREILDITVALAAMLDPEDDRVLFGFLRSPFVGLTDESLLHIVRQASAPCWRTLSHVALPSAEEQSLLTTGLEFLTRLVSIRDRVSVTSLIEELLADSGYLVHLELLGETTDGSPSQRIANIKKLIRLAGANVEITVSDFLRMIERERDLCVKESEARLFGERDDVVTVTSVHSAKGLEWKCVFWADLIRGKRATTGKFLVSGAGVSLGEPDISADEQSPAWQAVRAVIDAERDAETKRLWYVAATRARDLLILTGIPLGTGRASADAPASALKERFPGISAGAMEISYRGSTGLAYTATVRQATVISEATDDLVAGIPGLDATSGRELAAIAGSGLERVATPPIPVVVPWGRGQYSASEVMSFQRCQRRHWFSTVAGIPEPSANTRGSERNRAILQAGMSSVQRGVVVHDVLLHFDGSTTVAELVRIAIDRLNCEEELSAVRRAKQSEQIVAEVEGALSRPEYSYFRDATDARCELPFLFISDADCVSGQLDLIAPTSDGYQILDVKTGTSPAEEQAVIAEKAARYDLQRTLYTQAVEGITGRPVSTFAFDFIGSQIQHSATLSGPARADADERLASEVFQMKRGGHVLTSHAMDCRSCGYRTAGWCPGVAPPVCT